MDKVNWTKLEEKWRQRWIKEKDFEAEPDSREKKFITVAVSEFTKDAITYYYGVSILEYWEWH